MNEQTAVSGPDIETLLAESHCRALHRPRWFGAYRTSTPCVTCSEWAAHVAAVLRAHIVTAQADAWDEALVEASERGFLVAGYLAMVQANPYRATLVGQIGADHD